MFAILERRCRPLSPLPAHRERGSGGEGIVATSRTLTRRSPTTQKPRRSGRTKGQALWGYLMIAPMMIGFAIFFLFALVASLLLSFTDWNAISPPRWVGLTTTPGCRTTTVFINALRNTALLTVPNVALRLLLSMLIAIALNSRIRFRASTATLFFMPGADHAGGDGHDLEMALRSRLRADQRPAWPRSGCRSPPG